MPVDGWFLYALDRLHQVLRRLPAHRIVEQVEVQGQGVAGLGIPLDAAVAIDIRPAKGRLDAVEQLGVVVGIVASPEHDRHFRHDFRRMGEESRGEHLVRHRADAARVACQHPADATCTGGVRAGGGSGLSRQGTCGRDHVDRWAGAERKGGAVGRNHSAGPVVRLAIRCHPQAVRCRCAPVGGR